MCKWRRNTAENKKTGTKVMRGGVQHRPPSPCIALASPPEELEVREVPPPSSLEKKMGHQDENKSGPFSPIGTTAPVQKIILLFYSNFIYYRSFGNGTNQELLKTKIVDIINFRGQNLTRSCFSAEQSITLTWTRVFLGGVYAENEKKNILMSLYFNKSHVL